MKPLFLLFLASVITSCLQVVRTLKNLQESEWIEDDEKRLVNYIFKGYNKIARPVIVKTEAVPVEVGIGLIKLSDLIEKDQILVSHVWLRLRWMNDFMKWNSSDFGGIKSINVDPDMVWLPDIELYNSAKGHILDNFKKKIVINDNGWHVWNNPVLIRSFCPVNIEYFPFDEQQCTLRFGAWTYDSFYIDFFIRDDKTDLYRYEPSGEFDLVSFKADREILKFECCKEPYVNLVFNIHFRRKRLFYFNNLIVPCILITFASLLTFILPPNTGERVTLVITTLLSQTVFMLMVAENTPTNSDVTPMIAKFFMASMTQIGLALVITCLILNVYHSTRHSLSLPHFIRVLAIDILAPLLFITTPNKKKTSKVLMSRRPSRETGQESFLCTQTMRESNQRDHQTMSGHGVDDVIRHERTTDEDLENLESENEHRDQKKLLSNIKYLADREFEREKQEFVLDEWEIVAKVADRTFLILLIITIVFTSSMIFINVPKHLNEAN
ncbi:neuronal acetylcholine receptor subunit alpha-7-like [Xenia sp. Carnegie-2017]|uniref:neuronal acetylcholine receptor subunit alpha-7-like n=1 Tax=Xenia sp. Carnegie-2017 TaxID=2897299 RepID=UPI001F044615|nr:neuronal acetylcholine receptor subunit alpha-7-like [Xenia sp. Carnegie-2017]